MIKRYFILVNMLLVAAILYLSVQIFYQSLMARLDSGVGVSAKSGVALNPVAETLPPISHYEAVTQRDLFKTKAAEDAIAAAAAASAKQKEQATPEQPMEQTKLQVKLWGTVFSEGIASYAVIEDLKDKKQSLYRINDKIQIATVKEIRREKVILNSNGKDEVLEMGEKNPPAANKPIFPPAPIGEAQPSPSGAENLKLSRNEIQESINDVNNLMKQARIRPHFTDGKPDGLTITGVRPDSIFTKLGLQSGDIITGVDGREIQSVDDALRLYQSLKSSPNVSVQIRRRGEQKNMEYSIE